MMTQLLVCIGGLLVSSLTPPTVFERLLFFTHKNQNSGDETKVIYLATVGLEVEPKVHTLPVFSMTLCVNQREKS